MLAVLPPGRQQARPVTQCTTLRPQAQGVYYQYENHVLWPGQQQAEVPMKTCSKCAVPKPVDDFPKRAKARDGRLGHCKMCENERSRARYLRDADKIRESHRRYYEANKDKASAREKSRRQNRTSAQREETARKRREAYEAEKDRARARRREYYLNNRERQLAQCAVWRANNPSKVREYTRRYQLSKLDITVERVDYDILRERDKSCYLCSVDFLPDDETHVDHKIPISRTGLGPTHSYENCALTHATCNLRKGDRTPEEYWALMS